MAFLYRAVNDGILLKDVTDPGPAALLVVEK